MVSLQYFDALGWATRTTSGLHQNPLAIEIDISRCSTGCSTLWQPHMIVSAAEGATDLPRFTWKMATKAVCVRKLVS